ncbi:MAG: S1 RNA-binding domain-containing protein, partial [Desulfobacteraceae bacterium]
MNTTVDYETNQTTPNQEETSPENADATPEVKTDDEPGVSAEASRDAALKQLDTSEEDALETEESMESLMDMYEESFKRFAEGEVVTGKIISVDKDHVLVDIGYKSEGQISINEFRDENGDIQAEVDDRVEVMV